MLQFNKYTSPLSILIFTLCLCTACKNDVEKVVKFDSRTVKGEPLQLTGILKSPEGKGPFPAVVLLHTCAGLNETISKHMDAWAKRFTQWGHVSLIVDSFGPRGVGDICEDSPKVNCNERALDAYAAKSYLSRQKFVDPGHIAVIGWSHGGWAVMAIVDARIRERNLGTKVTPFQAAVAFYPYCQPSTEFDTPLLILIGEQDQAVRASLCENLRKIVASEKSECEFKLITYPGVHHCFDIEGANETYLGFREEYNPAAAEDAENQVRSFLGKYLSTTE